MFNLQVSLAMLKGETVVAVCVCQMCMYFCILEGSGVHRLKVVLWKQNYSDCLYSYNTVTSYPCVLTSIRFQIDSKVWADNGHNQIHDHILWILRIKMWFELTQKLFIQKEELWLQQKTLKWDTLVNWSGCSICRCSHTPNYVIIREKSWILSRQAEL